MTASKFLFEGFLGKEVKIRLRDNFRLTGTIDLVGDHGIIFSTKQKTSMIAFEEIARIQEVDHHPKKR